MKTITVCITVLFLAVASPATVQDTHTEEWTYFVVAKCKVGADQSEIDAVLTPVSAAQIIVQLGGTGHYVKYYAIDDFVQVAADFDPKKKLLSSPRVIPRTKWRRYPDGQGWVDAVDGQNVDPKDGTLIVP